MTGLETSILQCPYCWEWIEIAIDCSVEQQTYIEDCSVCCRPVTVTVVTDGGDIVSVDARSEDD